MIRWPWMSRSVHEDVVRELKTRLDDAEAERKKAYDELLRLLGGQPFNFPQPGQAQVQTSEAEPEPLTLQDEESEWLAYVAKSRPSQFAGELAKAMARKPMAPTFEQRPPVKSPEQKAATAAAFDKAENEVRTNLNGNHSAA